MRIIYCHSWRPEKIILDTWIILNYFKIIPDCVRASTASTRYVKSSDKSLRETFWTAITVFQCFEHKQQSSSKINEKLEFDDWYTIKWRQSRWNICNHQYSSQIRFSQSKLPSSWPGTKTKATRRAQNVSSSLSNQEIVHLFYKKSFRSTYVWICLCRILQSQQGSGPTNLIQHLDQDHPRKFPAAKQRFITNGQTNLSSLFYSSKMLNVHGWIAYVVHCLYSFVVIKTNNKNRLPSMPSNCACSYKREDRAEHSGNTIQQPTKFCMYLTAKQPKKRTALLPSQHFRLHFFPGLELWESLRWNDTRRQRTHYVHVFPF